MPVNMGKPPEHGPGWGCECRAFRMGEPTPEQALAALARSANVTVEDMGGPVMSGENHFVAWTNPQDRHSVTFDVNHAGGWCKHTIACLTYWAPWHRQLALGADAALERIKELEKELKKRDREIAKLQRST